MIFVTSDDRSYDKPIQHMKTIISIFALSLLFSSTHSQHDEWVLKKDKDGIEVYYREASGNDIKELKIVTDISCSLSSAVSAINNIDEMPSWVYKCAEAHILQTESESHFTFSSVTRFPVFFADRELVLTCTTYQDDDLVVYSRCSNADAAIYPHKKRNVRIDPAISNWKFTPKPGGIITAEYYLLADPGGKIPAWLVNMGLDYGPVRTIKTFKKMVQSTDYKYESLSYITEP